VLLTFLVICVVIFDWLSVAHLFCFLCCDFWLVECCSPFILGLIYLFDKLFKWWLYIDDHFHVIVPQLPRYTIIFVLVSSSRIRTNSLLYWPKVYIPHCGGAGFCMSLGILSFLTIFLFVKQHQVHKTK
jgi:hypothetical protein